MADLELLRVVRLAQALELVLAVGLRVRLRDERALAQLGDALLEPAVLARELLDALVDLFFKLVRGFDQTALADLFARARAEAAASICSSQPLWGTKSRVTQR